MNKKQIDKRPKISVILPIYNQESNLEISIPSVQNQTYRNLEIVCVNDGSTDSSQKIIKKYRNQDSRIIIINKENGGLVDAIITGVSFATGDYVVFLDPDDYIGVDFVENFLVEIGYNYFISMGYYLRCGGVITPQYLLENREYNLDDIKLFINKYLYDSALLGLSNRFFISRWNKMYKTECVKKIIQEFVCFKNISLGEDSIFTFLLLKNCKSCKTLTRPNSYFYNIGSQTSMMTNGSIESHCEKAEAAHTALTSLLRKNEMSEIQADVLYYFLMESLLERMKNTSKTNYVTILKEVTKKEAYINAVREFSRFSLKRKIYFLTKKSWHMACLYNFIQAAYDNMKKVYTESKWWILSVYDLMKDVKKTGVYRGFVSGRFRIQRKRAFVDLNRKMSILEKEILPIIKPFLTEVTDLRQCSIERNIFVFWWDGFEKAPIIVKKCLETVRKYYSDCKIIEISKNNFKNYTDINPDLLRGFELGNISIQTFSDILRFNLLKNNGGFWIDSTIFFSEKYDIFETLKNKPIESICFSTSNSFLKYKNYTCNWSVYFFAARKNSVFTIVMNEIFEKYYLQNRNYPIYFFTDAALMVCKINKIDGGALDNITYNTGDMFFLHRMLDQPYDECSRKILETIPQKLAWQFKPQYNNGKTFYDWLLKE